MKSDQKKTGKKGEISQDTNQVKKQLVGRYFVDDIINRNSDGSVVYLVSLKALDMSMVMRTLPITPKSEKYVSHAMRDVRVMSSIRHPFTAKFVDAFVEQKAKGEKAFLWYDSLSKCGG